MSDYAVVQVGTHQYRVTPNTIFDVERFDFPEGDQKEISLDQVLVFSRNNESQIGTPFVSKARVICEILGEFKQPKVISFKFKRRRGYRRKKGHRQRAVRLQVKSIQAD